MAKELGPLKIRTNAVNPTVTLTAMAKKFWSDPENSKPMLDRIPMQRFAEPEEVVEPILFLLSDKAAMINGIMMPIDGGFLAG
jgi:L-xylulose reductase